MAANRGEAYPSAPEKEPVFNGKLYVEIGVGYTVGYDTRMRFGEDDYYLGIDSGLAYQEGGLGTLSPVESIRQATDGGRAAHLPTVDFLTADARALPLPDQSVDELLAANIFSDPLLAPKIPAGTPIGDKPVLRYFGEPAVASEGGRGYHIIEELGEAREAILKEAARVLKEGGRLVVNSFLTPEYAYHQGMLEWLKQHGFEAVLLSARDEAWEAATRGYLDTDSPNSAHRVIIATKRS